MPDCAGATTAGVPDGDTGSDGAAGTLLAAGAGRSVGEAGAGATGAAGGGTAGAGAGTTGAVVGAGAGLAVAVGRGLAVAVGWQEPKGKTITEPQLSAAAGAAEHTKARTATAKVDPAAARAERSAWQGPVTAISVALSAADAMRRVEEKGKGQLDRIRAHGLIEQLIDRGLPFQLRRMRRVHGTQPYARTVDGPGHDTQFTVHALPPPGARS